MLSCSIVDFHHPATNEEKVSINSGCGSTVMIHFHGYLYEACPLSPLEHVALTPLSSSETA